MKAIIWLVFLVCGLVVVGGAFGSDDPPEWFLEELERMNQVVSACGESVVIDEGLVGVMGINEVRNLEVFLSYYEYGFNDVTMCALARKLVPRLFPVR